MRAYRLAVAALATVIVIGGWVSITAGQQVGVAPNPQLPGAPLGSKGEAIFPAFEAWGPHKDGQNVILVGYFNRNRDQPIDIPIGPNNRIEPGGPDYGQPTHFEPSRHYGVFAIPVPKDFGTKKLTWTLIANGHTSQVQLSLNPPYWVDFFKNAANGNTTPVIKFAPDGPELVGPPRGIAQTLTATVGQPLPLKLWATDKPNTYDPNEGLSADARAALAARGRGAAAGGADAAGRGADATAGRGAAGGAADAPAAGRGGDAGGRGNQNFDVSAAVGRGQVGRGGGGGGGRGSGAPQPDVTVTWKWHRGPAAMTFADAAIRLFNKGDINAWLEATTTATFSAPGEYWLRAQVNDSSGDGGGGDQCCWTNAHVKVTVK